MTDSKSQEIDKYISEQVRLGVFQVFADQEFYWQYKAKIAISLIVITFLLTAGFIVIKKDLWIWIPVITATAFFVHDLYRYNREYANKEKLKIIQEAIKLKKAGL